MKNEELSKSNNIYFLNMQSEKKGGFLNNFMRKAQILHEIQLNLLKQEEIPITNRSKLFINKNKMFNSNLFGY